MQTEPAPLRTRTPDVTWYALTPADVARALAVALGLLAVAAWWLARRRGADPALVHRLARICLLMGLQGGLGIIQFQLEVPAEMVWVHVALATLLWVGIVLAAVQAGSPRATRALDRAGRRARPSARAART